MKFRLKTYSEFLENISNNEVVKFENLHLNHAYGQDDYQLNAKIGKNIVAYANYSVFKGEVYINMIESIVKGKGYGRKVMLELARLYGYENITRNSFTPDGMKLRNRIDKELDFDYSKWRKEKSKHIKREEIAAIKNEPARKLIVDIVEFGYSDGFEKNLDKITNLQDYLKNYDMDVSDLAVIAEWIVDSEYNTHDELDEPPRYVFDYLTKLKN
jgi:hypothetical protein